MPRNSGILGLLTRMLGATNWSSARREGIDPVIPFIEVASWLGERGEENEASVANASSISNANLNLSTSQHDGYMDVSRETHSFHTPSSRTRTRTTSNGSSRSSCAIHVRDPLCKDLQFAVFSPLRASQFDLCGRSRRRSPTRFLGCPREKGLLLA